MGLGQLFLFFWGGVRVYCLGFRVGLGQLFFYWGGVRVYCLGFRVGFGHFFFWAGGGQAFYCFGVLLMKDECR